MQLHTVHRYFKSDTTEVGAVLGLLYKEIDIGTYFDRFREKIKGYTERKFENANDMICVVTYVEDTVKMFEDNNMTEYLNEKRSKVHLEEEKNRVSTDKIHRYIRNK